PTISAAHAPLANDDRAVNQLCRSSSSWVQVMLCFSAHGVPLAYVDSGDPYKT
uniref:Ferrochelatase n=1 Tax=Aegilops tauschii subsp. strangulata TaxID=200361 RepID=A0A453DVD7_AEGTS